MNDNRDENSFEKTLEPDRQWTPIEQTESYLDAPIELQMDRDTAGRMKSSINYRATLSTIRWVLVALAVLILALTLLGVIATAMWVPVLPDLLIEIAIIESFLILPGWAAYYWLGARIQEHEAFINQCIARLSALRDTQDIRMLFEFQPLDFPGLQTILIDRLTTIVNGIQPGADCGLSANEWKRRLEHIDSDWWGDPSLLIVAIIRMFERNRDPRAIEVIRRFAANGTWLFNGESVRQAANASLPVMEAALHEQKQRETLLRASGPSSAPAHELLRAASSANTSTPELLLRPSSGDNVPL